MWLLRWKTYYTELRARTTGRRIPMDALMDSLEKVPKSVDELSHHVDFLLEVDNSSGHGLQFPILQGMDGLDFGRRTIAVQRTILLWCFAIQYAERWNAAFNGFFGGSKQPDLGNWRASAIRWLRDPQAAQLDARQRFILEHANNFPSSLPWLESDI